MGKFYEAPDEGQWLKLTESDPKPVTAKVRRLRTLVAASDSNVRHRPKPSMPRLRFLEPKDEEK